MPLEVHDYLVAQGWGGKGTGLRQGAISRPLAIPMKKNLAGLGKDRDEAFPFWDHLYTAAAKSITIKYVSEDEGEDDEASTSNNIPLKKTSTGIFSTRRPVEGTPADSGNTTPTEADSDSQTPRLSLMAQAQRESAKRRLYAKFFRGPVLGPETIAEEEKRLATLVLDAFEKQNSTVQSMKVTEHIEIQTATERMVIDFEVSNLSEKKRKDGDVWDAGSGEEGEEDDSRKERKRRRKEEKRKKEDKDAAKLKRRKEKEKKQAGEESLEDSPESSSRHTKRHKTGSDAADKAEHRRKKEEKRRIKALRKQLSVVTIEPTLEDKAVSQQVESIKPPKERLPSGKAPKAEVEETEQPDKKKKKKRKRDDNPDDSS